MELSRTATAQVTADVRPRTSPSHGKQNGLSLDGGRQWSGEGGSCNSRTHAGSDREQMMGAAGSTDQVMEDSSSMGGAIGTLAGDSGRASKGDSG